MQRRFKVRDLMIQVLPDDIAPGGGAPAAGCGICTLCTQCSGCSDATCFQTCGATCGACTIVTMPGGPPGGCGCSCSCFASIGISVVEPVLTTEPGRVLESLRSLKERLRAALEEVDRREARLTEELKPQTIDEIDLLEKKLVEAQKDLRDRRQQLKKKG